MAARKRRTKALRAQQNVESSRGMLKDSMAALTNQLPHQSGVEAQPEPHTEKPDAALQEVNNPDTENPVAAGNRMDSGPALMPAPELTLAFMPRLGHAVLMRGSESMKLTPQEMMGLMAPTQPR